MGSPHVLELKGCVWQEAVISSDWSRGVVRWSSFYHGSVVTIVREESLGELVEGHSSVTIAIVSGHEKVNFVLCWEDINGVQTRSELVSVNGSVTCNVKDIKGVSKVKVVFLGKSSLSTIELLLSITHVLESMNELIFIVNSEDWLSGWRKSGWAYRRTSDWRRSSSASSVG